MKNKEIFIAIGVVTLAVAGMYLYKRKKDSQLPSSGSTTTPISNSSSDSTEKEKLLKEMESYADRQPDNSTTLKARDMYLQFKKLLPKMSLQECKDYVRIVLAIEKDPAYLTKKVSDTQIHDALHAKYGLSFGKAMLLMTSIPAKISNATTLAYQQAIAAATK